MLKHAINLILISAFIIFSSCNKCETCVENIKEDCICTLEFDPVCGCNNKTYSNACMAACSGITEFVKGECKK